MLRALYDYAVKMDMMSAPPGYARKKIKAFICLNQSGSFTGLRLDDSNEYLCPDIGSLANGSKSHVLAEKRKIVLPEHGAASKEKDIVKAEFFRKSLSSFAEHEPLALLCLRALENQECCAQIRQELDQNKIKEDDRISFLVDAMYLVECPTVPKWWDAHRLQEAAPVQSVEQMRCLITGQPTAPMKTVPKIKGLGAVGGHSSGDALICFDKKAFCSYGFEQSENAPVSEQALLQVNAALETLLKEARTLAGMKFVHWYDRSIPQESDQLNCLFEIESSEQEAEADEADEAAEWNEREAREAERQAHQVVASVRSGQATHELPSKYYIVLISGAGGRVMLRKFMYGAYEQLTTNLAHWNADLQLVSQSGTGMLQPYSLIGRWKRLLKLQSAGQKDYERMSKELAGICAPTLHAILQGTQLPDSVAARALGYLRSQMLRAEAKKGGILLPDAIACQWLKVWLIRNYKEVDLMAEYNPQHPRAAYHIGAMVAVYAALQQRAYPDVNVTVVQRFFASAQQTPAFVLGRLAKMSTHHLAKLQSAYLAREYEARLAQVSARIDEVPNVLTLPEQSLFALGYYQMAAAMHKEFYERKQKKEAEQNEQREEAEE